MPDALYADPRLAPLHDPLDPDRSDLDPYLAMAEEFGARRVLDVGCGTGTFACLLAEHGFDVIGVEPAAASLDVARAKPFADRVRWLHGDATVVPALSADLATMTANVAQVFLTDEEWHATLRAVHTALRPGGRLVFETRDPAVRAWTGWTRERTSTEADVPGVGTVRAWCEVLGVAEPLVSFRWTYVFDADGTTLTSDSTLRFRTREEVERSLQAAGYRVAEVRDAPDRPGRELVFVAVRE
ncbi:class I SAM-dependent methyltransferase [Saccharomonospora cyanea]|uniref:Methylase involved in ubiquinone/menaquinone biosynthesis n=1 Tax=Saccharomonospora cyanea NA-134 TaxID=882082 RepID=H5XK29_9PSEU|nr:class I SAM-dependent methyltransferase [Saccharomonospora cyanea]EHR62984.1 methylase involved in ubiquinone/menaquinone biosynthesis [Saccharomonospora cyanea NA-134]